MPDKFDPYREALIVETDTIWPEDSDLSETEKERLAASLHSDPAQAANLEYLRVHTGFCRTISVTEQDLARLES